MSDGNGNNVEPETKIEPTTETPAEYSLHIRLAPGLQPLLKNATDLAYMMGDIPKATLGDLMNLFIGWGLSIQKQKWLDRMGYK